MVGGVPYHFCGILHSDGTGGAPVWGGYVGLVRVHGEAYSRGPHNFFATGDKENGGEVAVWELAAGKGQDHYEGVMESGRKNIH